MDVRSEINATNDSYGDRKVDLDKNISGVVEPKGQDNNGGYIGFRSTDKNNPFDGDGAMDVVGRWRNNTSNDS
ncbi:MAG: hypothetical protein ACRD8Z_07685 [Nitrososphaeraceae archaeon]